MYFNRKHGVAQYRPPYFCIILLPSQSPAPCRQGNGNAKARRLGLPRSPMPCLRCHSHKLPVKTLCAVLCLAHLCFSYCRVSCLPCSLVISPSSLLLHAKVLYLCSSVKFHTDLHLLSLLPDSPICRNAGDACLVNLWFITD